MKKKEKLFLFYLKTGGGHLAPAKAVAKWLNENATNQIEPILIDGFSNTNKMLKSLVEDGYSTSQNKAKWIFEFLYACNKIKKIATLSSKIISYFTKDYIKNRIEEEKPDKIMIFHFFLIKPVFQVLKELGLSIPVFTVVTDPYSAPPIWFIHPNQHFIVFSDKLKDRITQITKKSNSTVDVVPFIVDKKFETEMTQKKKLAFKEKIGIYNDKSTTLIMGGGDGIPHGKAILKNLIKSNIDSNIILVAGNNKKLKEDALKLTKLYNRTDIIVMGYVDIVYELLNISDIVISKCGASTFMEILMSKKIPVINSYIWEQEKGNVEFVIDNNLGIYEKNSKKIPAILNEIFNDTQKKQRYIENITNKSLISGTETLSKLIIHG